MSEQSKAIEYAEMLESNCNYQSVQDYRIAAELRRLDAENEALRDDLLAAKGDAEVLRSKVAHRDKLIGMIDTICLEAGILPLDTVAMVRSLIAERDALAAWKAEAENQEPLVIVKCDKIIHLENTSGDYVSLHEIPFETKLYTRPIAPPVDDLAGRWELAEKELQPDGSVVIQPVEGRRWSKVAQAKPAQANEREALVISDKIKKAIEFVKNGDPWKDVLDKTDITDLLLNLDAALAQHPTKGNGHAE